MKGQTGIEFLLITVVLASLMFYAFVTVLKESEINIALSAAREECYKYALETSNTFKALNYSINNTNVFIKPVFTTQVNDPQLLHQNIIRAIFCSLDQNSEPKNCSKFYNPPSSTTHFIMDYTVK